MTQRKEGWELHARRRAQNAADSHGPKFPSRQVNTRRRKQKQLGLNFLGVVLKAPRSRTRPRRLPTEER